MCPARRPRSGSPGRCGRFPQAQEQPTRKELRPSRRIVLQLLPPTDTRREHCCTPTRGTRPGEDDSARRQAEGRKVATLYTKTLCTQSRNAGPTQHGDRHAALSGSQPDGAALRRVTPPSPSATLEQAETWEGARGTFPIPGTLHVLVWSQAHLSRCRDPLNCDLGMVRFWAGAGAQGWSTCLASSAPHR